MKSIRYSCRNETASFESNDSSADAWWMWYLFVWGDVHFVSIFFPLQSSSISGALFRVLRCSFADVLLYMKIHIVMVH